MPATPSATAPNIGFIQKKHVDIIPRRTPTNERNSWARGKKLQGEIIEAFRKHGTPPEQGKVAGMAACLTNQTWHECPNGHEGRLHQTHFCGHRLCPICQARRSILAKRKYKPAMQNALGGAYTEGKHLVALFVTLTWPSVAHMEERHVSQMWRDLGKLKRQKWWKTRVAGELWSLEWTFSPAFGHHSHAHGIVLVPRALYESKVEEYKAAGISGKEASARWWADNGPIPKPLLTAAWEKLTGAPVVDVRLIRPRRKAWGDQEAMSAAIDETLKYPIKETDYLADRKLRPEELAEIDRKEGEILDREEALVELYRAIRGRRLSDVRGVIRGQLQAAMQEVEEAKSEELLRMDPEELFDRACNCAFCGAEYVEREYVFGSRQGENGFYLRSTQALGTSWPHLDNQARRLIEWDRDRKVAKIVAGQAGTAWRNAVRRWRDRQPVDKLEKLRSQHRAGTEFRESLGV